MRGGGAESATQSQSYSNVLNLREEIARLKPNSRSTGINVDLAEAMMQQQQQESAQQERETKRIESVRVDIELKTLINKIRGTTHQIKEKAKRQREVSESILSEHEELE